MVEESFSPYCPILVPIVRNWFQKPVPDPILGVDPPPSPQGVLGTMGTIGNTKNIKDTGDIRDIRDTKDLLVGDIRNIKDI